MKTSDFDLNIRAVGSALVESGVLSCQCREPTNYHKQSANGKNALADLA
jgi:hypothetical protein